MLCVSFTLMQHPPPLAWLDLFCSSTGTALDQPIQASVRPTVNPLVYAVYLKWASPVSNKLRNSVWNLFQIWAAKNDCVPQGKVDHGDSEFNKELTVSVVVKQRLGLPKREQP